MSLHNHALYQITIKALLFKEERILVLITPDNYIDFPGGRVDESERELAWTEALKREVSEELGDSVIIGIGQTLFVSKRQYHKNGKTNYMAAIFFRCNYITGEINLSDEHSNYEWLTQEEILSSKLKFISEDERYQLVSLFRKSQKN
jgi:8-oxo-dGTP diphosphatase